MSSPGMSKNFLKEIVSPESPEVDIVAVHGLNPTNKEFHAEYTWTAGERLWLKDFLPSKLPHARVLLFSYNSNVAFETSISGVREHAASLLNWLTLKRRNAESRPIVFVAHSLGGIVVKRALVEAKLDGTYKSILDATYGVAFFGTPHRGSPFAKLGDVVASIVRSVLHNPKNTFMDSLKENSLYSDNIMDDFRHQVEKYQILSFYETQKTKNLGIIVDKKSGTLGLAGHRERQIAVEADHNSICKFASAESDNYQLVSFNLAWLVNSAIAAAAERQDTLSLSVPPTSSKPELDSESTLNEYRRSDISLTNDTFGTGVPKSLTMETQEYVDLMTGPARDSQEEAKSEGIVDHTGTTGRLQALKPRNEPRRGVIRENLSSLLGCTSNEERTRLMLDIQLNIGNWTKEEDVTDTNSLSSSGAKAQASILDASVDDQRTFSHLDNYILGYDPHSILDSTSISAEHSVVLEIQDWIKSPDSQMLWVIGPTERAYHSPTSKIAAGVVNSASMLSIPTISYFCDWPQKHQDRDPVVSILYSLIRQLLDLTSGTLTSNIDLSDGRLQLLNGSEQSLDEAMKIVKELVWLVQPLTLCILDGIDRLDYIQRNRQAIEALTLLLKERVTSDDASDGSLGTFKLLFTTAGNCGLLNRVGGGMLREVKCSGRSQRQRSGKPGPGRSTLQLTAGGTL